MKSWILTAVKTRLSEHPAVSIESVGPAVVNVSKSNLIEHTPEKK